MIKVKGLKCPNCGKKTLSNPENKRWSKFFKKRYCRSCGSRLKPKEKGA